MKDNKVVSEYRLHHQVLFLQKSVNNQMGNKYILSMGYDQLDEPTEANAFSDGKRHLVLKIWDFKDLLAGEYTKTAAGGIAGSCLSKALKSYTIEADDAPYTGDIKMFGVSQDLCMAGIILQDNSIYLYKLLEKNRTSHWTLATEKRMKDSLRICSLGEQYSEVANLSIFKDTKLTESQYSMCVACTNGVLIYQAIDLVSSNLRGIPLSTHDFKD